MKVIFNRVYSIPGHRSYQPGDIEDLADGTAKNFIMNGLVTPVVEPPSAKAERAVAKKTPKKESR